MGKIKQITGNNITTYAYVYDNNLIKNQLIQHYHHWPQKYKIQTNRTSTNMANHLRRTWIVDKKVKNEADLNIQACRPAGPLIGKETGSTGTYLSLHLAAHQGGVI